MRLDAQAAARRIPLALADLRGLSLLGVDATVGLADLVEQMHHTIVERAAPLGPERRGRTRGITGFVYGSIRGATRVLGRGLDTSLRLLERLGPEPATSPSREAALAVVNGVWGDHLEASGNPLAIPMALRVDGRPLELTRDGLRTALPAATDRIAVLVHGLCMNDLQWERAGHHHGRMLARELGYTALDLHYNSGRHVSENGTDLAERLETLLANWPVALRELVIVGHSMGGLVARAACHEADRRSMAWRRSLTRLVCLGTPHHGAVLERGGHLVDMALGISPYAAPFARLGKARSAGITDLRYGNLQRADWDGRAAHDQKHDDRRPTPLPEGAAVYLLAATTAEQPRGLRHAVIGDGLVALASAWGEHRDPSLALAVPASHRRLVTAANHWDLLSRPEAADALRDWLA
jgi:hypothetical protein